MLVKVPSHIHPGEVPSLWSPATLANITIEPSNSSLPSVQLYTTQSGWQLITYKIKNLKTITTPKCTAPVIQKRLAKV
jgi:hypothetical protein